MLWWEIQTTQLSPSFQPHTERRAQFMLWFHVPWHDAHVWDGWLAGKKKTGSPIDKGILFVFNRKGSSFWLCWESSTFSPKNSISKEYVLSLPQLGDSLRGEKKKAPQKINNKAAWVRMHTLQVGTNGKAESPGMGTEQGSDWVWSSCRETEERGWKEM